MTGEAERIVHVLAARTRIEQLKARYFRLMDTKRWEEWGQVFAVDAVMEVPEADVVWNGRDEIVSSVSRTMDPVRSVHHGHMPEIEITGPGTAEGIWAMVDFVEWPTKDGGRAGFVGYGHYHERYVETADGWRISHVRLERLRVDPLS